MTQLIDWSDPRYHLGLEEIDEVHEEFVALANQVAAADAAAFAELFDKLVIHTGAHFAGEEARMVQTAFPSLEEHRGEHARVLGEMRQLNLRVQAGRSTMARAYVKERLPEWFALHSSTMDSALAVHLKK